MLRAIQGIEQKRLADEEPERLHLLRKTTSMININSQFVSEHPSATAAATRMFQVQTKEDVSEP